MDRAIVRPIVGGYRRMTPRPVRHAVSNVLQNADEPVVFVNDVFQAHFGLALRTVARFVSNSTVGVAGVFDPATPAGLPHHDNGFGMTLGHYGVAAGPYVYVPLLGPTTLRDMVGVGVDYVADPLTWTKFDGAQTVGFVRTGLSLVTQRLAADEDLRTLDRTAADPYATLRSVYLQSRQAEIKGPDAPLEALPELPPDAPATPPETPPAPAAEAPAQSPPAPPPEGAGSPPAPN